MPVTVRVKRNVSDVLVISCTWHIQHIKDYLHVSGTFESNNHCTLFQRPYRNWGMMFPISQMCGDRRYMNVSKVRMLKQAATFL